MGHFYLACISRTFSITIFTLGTLKHFLVKNSIIKIIVMQFCFRAPCIGIIPICGFVSYNDIMCDLLYGYTENLYTKLKVTNSVGFPRGREQKVRFFFLRSGLLTYNLYTVKFTPFSA